MLANTCVVLARFCGFFWDKHIFYALFTSWAFCAVLRVSHLCGLRFYAFIQRFSQIAPYLDSEVLLARDARQASDYTLPFARF